MWNKVEPWDQDKGVLFDLVNLENGLTLELHDLSRNVAGDRWLVSFAARLEVSIIPERFQSLSESGLTINDVHKTLGDKVVYHYEKKRSFIDAKDKEIVFEKLKADFLDSSIRYLSDPRFPEKLILRKYKEAAQQYT